ncbi:unnamed protein product, partial [Iphiclides podalirius]
MGTSLRTDCEIPTRDRRTPREIKRHEPSDISTRKEGVLTIALSSNSIIIGEEFKLAYTSSSDNMNHTQKGNQLISRALVLPDINRRTAYVPPQPHLYLEWREMSPTMEQLKEIAAKMAPCNPPSDDPVLYWGEEYYFHVKMF